MNYTEMRFKKTMRKKELHMSSSDAERNITTKELRPYTERKFPNKLHYLSKHIKTMFVEGTGKFIPKFWDDTSINETELKRIEWMAGVEVHLHKHIIAFYGRDERDHRQKYLGPMVMVMNNPSGFEQLEATIQENGFHITMFLMETTGIYHFPVAWYLKVRFPNSRVIAMNAGDLKDLMPKVSKNDKADAVRMAQVAQLDEFVKSSYLPDPDWFALRELLRQRTKVVRLRIRLKNVIRKIFASAGFSYKFDFEKTWEMKVIRTFLESDGTIKDALNRHQNDDFVERNRSKYKNWEGFNMKNGFKANILLQLGILGQTELNIEMMEAALLRQIEHEPKLQIKLNLLEECTGIGIFTALGIILESGNIDRFHSVSHYLSYCGIGPSQGTSGYIDENSEQEKIVSQAIPNPHSNRELKLLFVGATGSILRASKEQCGDTIQVNDMLRYSERYINDNRTKMKLKFKIAAKLARRVFYCLKHNLKYDPSLEYTRSCIYKGTKETIVQKRPPKRKRQAWAYKIMSRMQVDVADMMRLLQQDGDNDDRMIQIREDFKLFMQKYRIPAEFGPETMEMKA